MEAKNTIVFDIIGTSFSLGNVQRALTRAGAPEPTLPLWFAQSLRDAFALSQAGGYQPLKSILHAELPRTLGQLGAAIPPDQVEQVLAAFGQLEPQPGLTELIPALAGRGWRLLALTNSSVDSVRALLQRTGLLGHFAALLSTDQVRKMKPHPDVYELARREAQGEIWMLAAHAWDIQGAIQAGFRTIFVSGLESGYLDVYPKPHITVTELGDVLTALTRFGALR